MPAEERSVPLPKDICHALISPQPPPVVRRMEEKNGRYLHIGILSMQIASWVLAMM